MRVVIITALAGLAAAAGAQDVELGRLIWLRDYGKAIELAKTQNKPIMLLFQEIPGCATCTGFGKGALSDPAIFDLSGSFVCVAIHNNKTGADAEVLKKFGEPAWNNPVVRFVNAAGVDLIPRKDGVYTKEELLERMRKALAVHQKP